MSIQINVTAGEVGNPQLYGNKLLYPQDSQSRSNKDLRCEVAMTTYKGKQTAWQSVREVSVPD